MITLRVALVVLLVGLPHVVRGQSRDTTDVPPRPPAVVERITDAFSAGSAERLLSPAADRVEVSLFGTRTFYSNAQAFYVLRDFFDDHAPRRFNILDVTETETSCFVTGAYRHMRSERVLQVYVRMARQGGGAWHLHEVRIDANAE